MRGFVRVSTAVPRVRVGDPQANAEATLALIQRADAEQSQLVVFPELGLTGYTARDLFLDRVLLDAALAALGRLVEASAGLRPLCLVGLPVRTERGVFNVAAAFQGGKLLGLVPKLYLPNYREFEEARWFRSGLEVPGGSTLSLLGQAVPFGRDVMFVAEDVPHFRVGIEICEDLWVQSPPHAELVSSGVTVMCNLSASNFLVGKADLRKLLCASASDRGKCAYLYVAAGPTESSTDLAFDGHALIYENGNLLVESKRFLREPHLSSTELDLHQLSHEREVTGTFADCAEVHGRALRRVGFRAAIAQQLSRTIAKHPFVPKNPVTLAERCWEVFEIQTHALATRLERVGAGGKLVLGLSGGLDSTHAALVCASALDLLGKPRSELVCLTMPGFGSSDRTQDNAELLAGALGASFRRAPISELSHHALHDMEHPAAGGSVAELVARVRTSPELGDLAFENVQARMRTLLLMSVANHVRGLVVGTGDLSEKALGWSTYAGDQISMYDVNAGVPKTLIQFLIRWVANERIETWASADHAALRAVLFSILDTPISPELLPPDEGGKIAQLTEANLGPYELHDFFLFHFLRYGRAPSDVLALAAHAFGEAYEPAVLKRWLGLFVRRFFTNQFKRSCTPDGPKVGMVALSPRGDWRMPSDVQFEAWLRDLDP
jgi:NAD+ synthase (glutamine-hydrolysing)